MCSAGNCGFFEIRSAPLASPAGTVGEPVASEFNDTLGCWELAVPGGGVEVNLALHAYGGSHALGSPVIVTIEGTVVSAGYGNGVGGVSYLRAGPTFRTGGLPTPAKPVVRG